MIENDRAKILWGFYIRTDKQAIANKPAIVVMDKNTKYTTIKDSAVPNDRNIKVKELEKVDQYQPLQEELEKTWKTITIVVPVVVGALGAVTPKHIQWLAQIPGKVDARGLQKCALLVTGKVLRRFLKLPGFW